MKAKDIVGKTIKRVVQERYDSNTGAQWCIEAIEFTDGTWLRFLVHEGPAEYGISGIYPAREVE